MLLPPIGGGESAPDVVEKEAGQQRRALCTRNRQFRQDQGNSESILTVQNESNRSREMALKESERAMKLETSQKGEKWCTPDSATAARRAAASTDVKLNALYSEGIEKSAFFHSVPRETTLGGPAPFFRNPNCHFYSVSAPVLLHKRVWMPHLVHALPTRGTQHSLDPDTGHLRSPHQHPGRL